MAVYTHLSKEHIESLAAPYGFTALSEVRGIAEGVENSNFMIAGVRSGQPQKAILTVFEKRIRREELPFFMGLMQHVAGKGVPCPLPLLQEGGEALSEVNGKPLSIVTFLQGQCKTILSEGDCRALGAAMARLHVAAMDASLRRANDLSLAGWQRLYRVIAGRLDGIAQGLEQQVAQALLHLEAQWPQHLPRGIIHADLFPNNVFFDEAGALSGIIDFYFACEDMLAYDIAICLNSWCFDNNERDYNAQKASAMLEGYETVRPLEQAERSALPLLAQGAALRFLLSRAHDWLHHDAAALVTPLDPLEYAHKLAFWQKEGASI